MGRAKHSHEFVYNYYKENNYIMKSIYNGNKTKDKVTCPVGHEIKITFNDFQQGKRCGKCSGSEKHSHEYVYNYYANENYTLKSIYQNALSKDKLICPEGHEIEMRFNNFKSHGRRCQKCHFINNVGKNHSSFNLNREELPLNQRLRRMYNRSWVIKNMKEDPKYQDFLLNKTKYVVDHIIPVKLFCQLFTKYSLDEQQVKKIVNQRSNLQLLTTEENWDKFTKGSSLFEATNYLINNGIPFETFLETKVNI